MNKRWSFLRNHWAVVLNLVLVLQAVGFYTFSQKEDAPVMAPLTQFPERLGEWRLAREEVMDEYARNILHPDDYLLRVYAKDAATPGASLFVAYFRSQRTGHAPHSPRNCLPGNGWVPEQAGVSSFPALKTQESIAVNRYVVAKADQRSLVLYWYQTPTRVLANEYWAKIFLVLDSIRFNRSDTALVRIVVPLPAGDAAATGQTAIPFAQLVHSALRQQIPEVRSANSAPVPPGGAATASLE